MEIREFAMTDKAAVVQLWRDCGLVVPWNDPGKDIERKLATGADLFLVGERAGEIVACAMGGYDGHRGWVNYLAVTPDLQHHGYGRQMMAEIENRLVARGCPKINLQVRTTNAQVRRFYEALGYTQDAVVSYGKRLIPDQ